MSAASRATCRTTATSTTTPFGQCFLPQNQDPQRVAANPTALLGNNCKDANFLKPYQGYSSINLYESQATANYNALQVQVQRRATKGLFLGASYTWSKAMATAQSGGTNDNSFVRPDQFNRMANYGPASFDRRHVLAINYVYNTPKCRFGNFATRLITDGWQISGVTQALTGSPFTPGFSISGAGNQNITGSNTEGARIGVVAGCDPYTHSSDPFNRLNAACFFAPSPGSVGLESGINYLYAPGRRQLRHRGRRRSSPSRKAESTSSSAWTPSTPSTTRISRAITAP